MVDLVRTRFHTVMYPKPGATLPAPAAVGKKQNAAAENDKAAPIEYDADMHMFHGRVLKANSVITFYGASVDELEREFAKHRGSMSPTDY